MRGGSSPARYILKALRAFALVCAGLVVLIIGIETWKTWFSGIERVLVGGDYVFFTVLGLLLIGLLWLVRAISQELKRS